MSGHKPGTDHVDHSGGFEEFEGTGEELLDSTTGEARAAATPSGRTRIGVVAVTGALVLSGAVTAYGVTKHNDPLHRQQASQALDIRLAADRAAADNQAAADAAEETAAQRAATTASAKAAVQKLAADKAAADKAAADAAAKAAADRAAAAAKANRDAQRPPLPAPTHTSSPVSSGSSTSLPAASYGSPQAIAEKIVPASQYQCFATIISRESGWNVHATNPSSGAYGLGQALPGSKMASAGPDWENDPATQIRWTLSYMDNRYGSPCGALAFWNSHGWY